MSREYLFNEDFKEFIIALNSCDVEYLLVGGFAVILYGYARTTGDMDIWVNPTAENYKKLRRAFELFGLPVFDMNEAVFLDTVNNDVFTFGRPPVCIEILTKVKGLDFEVAYKNANPTEVGSLTVKVLGKDDLINAKRAAGRLKDQDDLLNL